MECLADRIGLRKTGLPVKELNINDLPGITLENIEALADDGDDGFADVWRKVKLAVNKKFNTLLRAEFNKCCKLSGSVIDCIVCDTTGNAGLFDVPLWYLHGVELMIIRTSTDAMNRYTTIDLDKAERLKEEYYVEFQSSLSDAVKSINVSESDCLEDCTEGNEAIRFVYGLP